MRGRATGRGLIGFGLLWIGISVFSEKTFGEPAQKFPEQQTATPSNQKPPEADKRGTAELPLVIKTIPPEKTEQEATNDEREREDKRWNDRATLGIGALTLLILAVQTIVFGVQARRLRQTIITMQGLGDKQSDDTAASIAEATRAASAMENMAGGIADTVLTNKAILASQREFWIHQMRAYVSVDIGTGGARQSRMIRFEFKPVITNYGSTPANRLTITSRSRISYGQVPGDFDYSVNRSEAFLISVITLFPRQSRIHNSIFGRKLGFKEMRDIISGAAQFHLWGTVEYYDLFDIKRTTNFSFLIFVPKNKRGLTIWHSTEHHNNAT